ncbi:MAG: hypothetical protein IPK10_02240 [Bacteroidetes bacterium]|nr:hypothetical protein [Bacteroidota bacterium]
MLKTQKNLEFWEYLKECFESGSPEAELRTLLGKYPEAELRTLLGKHPKAELRTLLGESSSPDRDKLNFGGLPD